jgi:hypothetical protein
MIEELPMILFRRMADETQPPTAGPISLWRDMIRDWRRWSRAERAAALSILAAVLMEISLSLSEGIRSFV